ncbi:3-isopropylmalate dehydratase large subunit [Sphingomonas bacterium]|uniref:3-isopropylmalate dehydratase large subunit n=1 Tax=Sphingomonas bacterium TaxID=1895847 RepID=UPI0015774AED|nr:3-isopropylmalate dehydratase large subunit [Sphingomonas bacterium]
MASGTLYEKLWNSHVVSEDGSGNSLLYVDRHILHEVSTPTAFDTLRQTGRAVQRPDANLAVADHSVPTRDRGGVIADPLARAQVAALARNCAEFGIPYLALEGPRQGIVHVVGPELGFTLPGALLVCGDSHTSTHGAFGALAFGIGASECEIVMATQCIRQRRARTMLVQLEGEPAPWVCAKDVALAVLARLGSGGGTGHAIEFAGPVVDRFGMSERMTLCNMAIETGARIGLIAPDATTIAYLEGRPMAPGGAMFDRAAAAWRTLASDGDASFDRVELIDVSALSPCVTWGTTPDDVIAVDGRAPDPAAAPDAAVATRIAHALDYMGLAPGQPLAGLPINAAFIGSCTNGRIEDLRSAAAVAAGRHVRPGVRALVVPGSTDVKRQAEDEGLDHVFRDAGFEWREAGCSLCVAINDDRLQPGQRCASTSNRNFEGRQGRGARTHLMSPAMAAAAAIAGAIVDVRAVMA